MTMTVLLVLACITSFAMYLRESAKRAKAERRAVRLEQKVQMLSIDVRCTRAQHRQLIDLMTEMRVDPSADVVTATLEGVTETVRTVLNPVGALTPIAPPDDNVTYLSWTEDEPVEFDDDGLLIVQGAAPGTPDDWEAYDPEILNLGSGPDDAVAEEL